MRMGYFQKSVHRKELERLILRYRDIVTGLTLDIGSKNRRYDCIFSKAKEIIAIDLIGNPLFNVISADARNLPFRTGTFDIVISFETLEYVLEAEVLLSEVNRVIKNGGKFIFSIPFLNPVHGEAKVESDDTDVVRYTNKGLFLLMRKYFSAVRIFQFGGRWLLMFALFFDWVRRKNKLFRLLLFVVIHIFEKLSRLLDKLENKPGFAMGYFVICEK
jgi:SAM-dependent methyltransferase